MSAPQADTYSLDTLALLREFAGSESAVGLIDDERAKLQDVCGDAARLGIGGPDYRWPRFGAVFSGFERMWSLRLRHISKHRALPALDDRDMRDAAPRTFAGDYETFDALSVRYGALFRGSVIVNYLLGVVAVGLTVASVLPQPRFMFSSPKAHGFPEFSHYATLLELACIVCILLIYCRGRTPHPELSTDGSKSSRHGWLWWLARRWRERWLEYRLLAERFRYIELMLAISESSASQPPFYPAGGRSGHWYDEYFVWRAGSTRATQMSARKYQKQAVALMLEQVVHHDNNRDRRGSIAARLERFAVGLFFLSLVVCAAALVVEMFRLHCRSCEWTASFDDNFRSMLLFFAVLAPTVSAAIHGVLATTEYTKLAESSSETANRIASLVEKVDAFQPGDGPASPEALGPIRNAVTDFADAAINEASGWRATLHDKNVPLG
jgi:hypothetical protein